MTVAVDTPRLGFLGVGWIGGQRMQALADSGLGEGAALAHPAVDGALAGLGEVLEGDLEGVGIATPGALHAEQARAVLERGLAVFCQKPLALDAAGARSVVDAARLADRLLGVDLSYRLTRAAREVQAVVASGDLGRVFAVDLVFHNAYGPDKPWFFDPALSGGGCVIDLGIHLVDLALWVLGFPAVAAVESHLEGEPLERYASAQLELEGGAVVRLACSWHLPAGRDCAIEASFYGTGGGASLRNVGGSFFDFRADRYDGTRSVELAAPPDDWGGRALLEWARRLGRSEEHTSEL